jgi:hypothetical protein
VWAASAPRFARYATIGWWPPLPPNSLNTAQFVKMKPAGVVEKFLCARVAAALEAFDTAVPSNALRSDPLHPTQEQVVEELFSALRELRSLQVHRRAK